jgi:two-component system sensor histidine kinase BarA
VLSSRTIRAKLALVVAASVGAAVLIAFGIGGYRELSRFAEAKQAEMQATAEILAVSAAEPVAAGDRSSARRALNAIGRIPNVSFAEIRGADGAPFAEAGIGVGLTADRDAAPVGQSSFWRMLARGSLFVTADIVKGGRKVGRLGLLVDTSELGERLRQALAAAALSAAAAVGIGLLVAARLQRSITRPLGELARTMNEVRLTSDFAQRAERRSDDETGQLVDAFNDMLDQIGQRDRALEDHRAGLERTIDERTRELATARDAAEAANRAKSDFLATMSHEIRTPMNGMLVMAELLAGTDLPARQQRYAETIVRSGQTLLTIINDILDLSKIEAGKLELEQGRVPVGAIVDDVLGLFWERARSKGIDIAAIVAADVPAVIEGDPVRLSQVLSNLVNNALKFTERGHVTVAISHTAARSDRAELLFRITDTGIGIAADQVDRIFEAFSQADQSTTRRFGGTGLGLSICQRLVAAMGGRIWIESEPGEGSTFAFTMHAHILDHAPPLPAIAKSVLVAVEGGATHKAVAAALAETGCAVQLATESTTPTADLVFASPKWIDTAGRALAGTQMVCVAGVGDGGVDHLLGAGLAQGLLVQPVSSGRVREILQAAEAGTLSSLLETRRSDSAAELPDLSGVEVLVADDSPVNREVVSEALTRLKARTRTVEDGVQALQTFKAGRFDIVLMDCSMPEMDGFAATRAIRAWEQEQAAPRTPVVALTAHVAGVATDSWREAGMDDYLTKPFTISSLAGCLARHLTGQQRASTIHDPATEADEPAGSAADAEAAPPLHPEVLASLRAIAGGNSAMLEKILGLFQAHAPARIAALAEAVAAGDLARTASEAHALKSPSLNIGALRLADIAAEIEAKARSGGADFATNAALQRLRAELDRVLAAIDAELPGSAPEPRPKFVAGVAV